MDFETFIQEVANLLNILGLGYLEDNEALNGTRANYLFRALPEWLTRRIQEVGRPHDCPHPQWCFGRVKNKAREL